MHFLGDLGINIKLLIAQIIDFCLLVALLSYFLYKPTIRIIEKNEAELEDSRKQKMALEEEKGMFAKRKEKDLAAARALGKRIVDETEATAEMIKFQAYESTKRESKAIIEQTKEALQSQRPMIRKEVASELNEKFGEGFKKSFGRFVEPRYQAELQGVLFKGLLDQIDAAEFQKISDDDIKELRKAAKADKKGFERMALLKVGSVSLEYAVTMPIHERKKVDTAIAAKVGIKVPVAVRQNPELINGFRLELMGRVIESNLSKIVQHAENT
jgi:F-type H+-transporting ATPase subunit b